MNVIAVNPFAGAQADGAVAGGNSSGESTDAAGLFAALLANIVTGVSTPEGGEPDVVAASVTVDADDVTADVDEESAEAVEANSAWLPDGMVAVQASLMAAPVASVAPVLVAAEASTAEAALTPVDTAANVVVPATAVAASAVESAQDAVVSQAPLETVVADGVEVLLPSGGATGDAARVLPDPEKTRAAATPAAPETAAVVVEDEAARVAAAEAPKAAVPAEVEAPVKADAQPKAEALVLRGATLVASETPKESGVAPVEGSSKKAQLRELVAKRAAEIAAAEDAGSDAADAEPELRVVETSSKPVRTAAEVLATAPRVARAAGESTEEGEVSPVSATQGHEGMARPGGVTLHRESGVAGTTASAPAAAPVEVPVLDVPKFTESSIKQMLDSGEQRMSIRIKPDTLGEMQIEVTRSGSDVQVRLTAATQAVRDLLDTHAPQLREALAREGFDAAKVQVAPPSSSSGLNLGHAGAGQQGQHAQQQQQQQHGGNALWSGGRFGNANATGPASTAPSRRAALAGGGSSLNITV